MSPFKPVRHSRSAVFIREEQLLTSQSTPAFGSTVRWDINKSGDYIDKLWLVLQLSYLVPPDNGLPPNFACWADLIGYACIKELRVIYSSQILQRVKKEELYIWHHRFLNDEERAGYGRMVGSIPSQADRIAAAINGITMSAAGTWTGTGINQAFKVPLWTLWFTQSEAQCLMIQGLSNKLRYVYYIIIIYLFI